MPAVESQMLELGTIAPAFSLPDPDGTLFSLRDDVPVTLVMFLSNHCPFVKHIRIELARIGSEYGPLGIAIYAINSNDVDNYPADHPHRMKEEAAAWGYTFPYLYDESQEVAKAYRAACTPDFYVFDADHRLVYRGQLDDSRPGNGKPIDGHDLRAALEAALDGAPASERQVPSIGCSIKWKPGSAPDYS